MLLLLLTVMALLVVIELGVVVAVVAAMEVVGRKTVSDKSVKDARKGDCLNVVEADAGNGGKGDFSLMNV